VFSRRVSRSLCKLELTEESARFGHQRCFRRIAETERHVTTRIRYLVLNPNLQNYVYLKLIPFLLTL
jgi:hypothetical protein